MVTKKDIKAVQVFEDQFLAAAKNAISDQAKEMMSAPISHEAKPSDSASVVKVKNALAVQANAMFDVPHKCGYCGSTNPPIPYEEMYGPGTHGWDCCPDCGGV